MQKGGERIALSAIAFLDIGLEILATKVSPGRTSLDRRGAVQEYRLHRSVRNAKVLHVVEMPKR